MWIRDQSRRTPAHVSPWFAIHMVKHGCDVERLKRLLGHASIQTSVVYLRSRGTDLDEIYDQVSL